MEENEGIERQKSKEFHQKTEEIDYK